MIFLDFVLDTERDIFWLTPVEKALHKIGKLDQLSVVLALVGIYVMYSTRPRGQARSPSSSPASPAC